jgi:hypothetical protein
MPPEFNKEFNMKRFRLHLLLTAVVLVAAVTLLATNPVETSTSRNSQWPPQAGAAYNFGGPYEVAYKAVPTTLTDLDTQTIHLLGYCFYNSTAGALTITIQTKDASPLPLPLSGALAAGGVACFSFPAGLKSTGGASLSTTTSGMYYHAVWTH